ncbi:MAG: haloacid dehalogenase type II [Burkholderiales bacterium]|nr:haloacid dehalogenase type II [Burkholderiales bacterium]
MKLSQFSTLMFDCYGTLIDWEAGLLAALRPWLRRHGVALPDAAVLEAFGVAESQAQARTPAKRYPEILADAMQALASRWGLDCSAAQSRAFGTSVGEWPAFPDSAEALRYLKQHYRLVILSNVDRASFALSNARLGVAFDHVFTAEDIGSYKPDIRNFEYALSRLEAAGVGRGDVLHVAQSLFHDHVPAKRLGLASVWIDRRAGKAGTGATPPAEAKPDWRFESLAAMAAAHAQASA